MARCGVCCLIVSVVLASFASAQQLNLPISNLTLPAGFQVELFWNNTLASARSLAISEYPNATITYVSTSSTPGNVYAIVDYGPDGHADAEVTVLSGLRAPDGIDVVDGALYVAEVTQISRFDNADAHVFAGQTISNTSGVVLLSGLPNAPDHNLHYMKMGPDGMLYFTLGSPANIGPCEPYLNTTYCTINRINADGSGLETYASGVRNSVGYDWHPETGEFFFTNNGRDNIGNTSVTDNIPDDTLNAAPEQGLFFGFPYCNTVGYGDPFMRDAGFGYYYPDPDEVYPETDNQAERLDYCQENVTPPVQDMGPHVAALGMRFYTGDMFPASYNNSVFVANHGSWDRTQKIGYRVVNVPVSANGTVAEGPVEVFAQGWLPSNSNSQSDVWGRPVDVQVYTDGSLLISDDLAGAVYRVTYTEPTPAVTASSIGR